MKSARPASALSEPPSYFFSPSKLVAPLVLGASLVLIPTAPESGQRSLPGAVSEIGAYVDQQRDTTFALLSEIEDRMSFFAFPDVIVPLPQATRRLTAQVVRTDAHIRMPETAADYDHLA